MFKYVGVGGDSGFKNAYEFVNQQNTYVSMYGHDILCGISKGIFEISFKIAYRYIERYDFYTMMKL